MKQFRIDFKVIDHYSDDPSPEESTIIPAINNRDALNIFYANMAGASVWLGSDKEIAQ